MFSIIKSFFKAEQKKELSSNAFTLSKEVDTFGDKEYKSISEAIEATNGNEFYINQNINNNLISKGLWKNYILQKN